MNYIIDKRPIIKSNRQPQNLKKILTKAKFTQLDQQHEVKRCNDKKCGLCKNNEIIEGHSHLFKNHKQFFIKSSMSCFSQNLIYVLICNNCQEEYIGETGDTLRHRTTTHRQQIYDSNYRNLKVSKHIFSCAINQKPKFKIMPILKIKINATETKRRQAEAHLIHIFNPSLNS